MTGPLPQHPLRRALVTARLGVVMMLHDRARFLGTVAGVVFAVVLAVQQLGILFGLLEKNTMFVDHAGADVWIGPPGVETFNPYQPIPLTALQVARTTPGVRLASPLLVGGALVKRPDGGTDGVTLIGTDTTSWLGGPWNLVLGDRDVLLQSDTVIFETAERQKHGGLNVGSLRELNGRLVHLGGFTWGLLPFGPAYAFASIDLARDLVRAPPDRVDWVLVTAEPGHSPEELAAVLKAELPQLSVQTRQAFHDTIVSSLLREQLGASFGISTSFGLVIGLVVVALSMFSSVIDNLREFGTLKAIGCTNRDLTVLVLAQSVGYATFGSLVGLTVATALSGVIRSPQLVVILPAWLVLSVPVVMLVLCLLAAVLALRRVRRLEPGMVFR